MPAASSTASAPEDRDLARSASAMASDGRALTVDAAGEPQLGVEDVVAQLGDVHGLQPDAQAP